jgi:hypothetical protein
MFAFERRVIAMPFTKRALRSFTSLALIFGLGACKPAPPQVILRIDSDIPSGTSGTLNAISVALISPETGLPVAIEDADPSPGNPLLDGGFNFFRSQIVLDERTTRRLPGDFAVSTAGRYRLLVVEVTAQQKDPVSGFRDLFTVRAVAQFPRQGPSVLWMHLAQRCVDERNQRCPAGYTCGRFGCEPEVRGELPPIELATHPPDVVHAVAPIDDQTDAAVDDVADASMSRD